MSSPAPKINARVSQPAFGWNNTTITVTGRITRRRKRVTVFMNMPNGKFVALELRNLDSVFALANELVDAAESLDNREDTAA